MADTLTAAQLTEMYVGRRVQLFPYHDAWMMGDRYGEITSIRDGKFGIVVVVRLDRSGKTIRVAGDEVLSRTID